MNGNTARDAGDWPTAARFYREHLEREPSHFPSWMQLGNVLLQDGKWIEALIAYSRAQGLRPDDAELLACMDRLHHLMGAKPSTRSAQRRPGTALGDGSQPALLFASQSGATSGPGERLAPLTVLRPARGLPGFRGKAARQALAHGDAARDRRVWILAISHYQQYLELRPREVGIWVQLGHALKESGRFQEALDAYRTAEALKPDDADLMLSLGHLHKLMGERRTMSEYYQRSFGLDGNEHARRELETVGVDLAPLPARRAMPGSAPSGTARASCWPRIPIGMAARADLAQGLRARDSGQWALACEHYSRYVARCPRDFGIWVQFGHALKEAGRLQDSLEAYGKAYRLNAADADLLLNLGHLHKVMGDVQSARAYYERSFALDGNMPARDELAAMPGALP